MTLLLLLLGVSAEALIVILGEIIWLADLLGLAETVDKVEAALGVAQKKSFLELRVALVVVM